MLLQTSLLEEFSQYLRGMRHLSKHVENRHLRWVGRWVNYLCQRDEDPMSPHLNTVADWSAWIREHLSPSSQRQALAALRAFYEYLWLTGRAAGNPFKAIKADKPRERARTILTVEQMRAMFAALDGTAPTDIRDRAILHYMYATLCRPGEACEATIDSLDLKAAAVIRYSPKTRREKWVPLYPDAVEALKVWLQWGRPYYLQGKRSPFLFIGALGRSSSTRNGRIVGITTETLRQIIRRTAERAGITLKLTPYDIRHTAATHLLENGADIRYIQELLDHVDIRTTQIYTHVRPNALRRTYEQYHPMMQNNR